MTNNQSACDLEYLFSLRVLLQNSSNKLPFELKRSLSLFLDSALVSKDIDLPDLKMRGAYCGLLLGSSNPTLLNDFFGAQPKGFVKDDATYLIEAEKTYRDCTLVFDFIENTGTLARSKQDILTRLFKKYNPETDIARFLGTTKFPSLLIKGFDISFLIEPDEDVKLLLGANLIRKIKISIPDTSNHSAQPKLRSLHIITPGFAGLHELSESDKTKHFNKPTSEYNFIFLNDSNDFLIKFFFDSIFEFEKNCGLENALSGIHKTLFFVKDKNHLSSTRLANECPEYKRFLNVDFFDKLDFKSSSKSYSTVLSCILQICSEIGIQRANGTEAAVKLAGSVHTIYSEYHDSVTTDGKRLLPLYLDLTSSLTNLMVKYSATATDVYKENREAFFAQYEAYLETLLSFISKYLRSKENMDVISRMTADATEAKTKYVFMESKFIFMKSYTENHESFKTFVLSKIDFLKKFIDGIPNKVQLESVKLFFTELDRQSQKLQNFEQYLETDKVLRNLEKVVSLELVKLMNRYSVSGNTST